MFVFELSHYLNSLCVYMFTIITIHSSSSSSFAIFLSQLPAFFFPPCSLPTISCATSLAFRSPMSGIAAMCCLPR